MVAQEVIPASSRHVARRIARARGLGFIDLSYAGSGSVGGSTSSTGVPPAPSTSTGNARADNFRAAVHKYGAAAAVAFPEAAPFIAAGVGILDAWVAVNAAFQGESWDSDDYQEAAAAAAVEYMRRGYNPPHPYLDFEFFRSYASRMESQLVFMTAQGEQIIQQPAPYTNNQTGRLDPKIAPALLDLGHAFGATKSDPDIAKIGATGQGFPFVDVVLFNTVPFADEVTRDHLSGFGSDPHASYVTEACALIAAKNYNVSLSAVQELARRIDNEFCDASSPYGHSDCGIFPEQGDRDATKIAEIWIALDDYGRAYGKGLPKTATKTATGGAVRVATGGISPVTSAIAKQAAAGRSGSVGQFLRRRAAHQAKSTKKAAIGAGLSAAAVAALVAAGALL